MAEEKKDSKSKQEKPALSAKKAFTICHNEFFREIKVGDDLSDVPEVYIENLKTEGVL